MISRRAGSHAVLSSLQDVPLRLLTKKEADVEEEAWTKRWRFEIAPKPVKPGVWRLKGGGHLIRGKATDYRTGKKKIVLRALRQMSASEAYRELQEELDRVRSGRRTAKVERIRFDRYAALLFERKVAKGEIRSAQTRENWELNLRLHLYPKFGDFYIDAIEKTDVEKWLSEQATRVAAKKCSPHTVNNWLRLFSEIVNEAVDELELPRNPLSKVRPFDTSMHVTYSEEQPNALTPEEIPDFLLAMRERHPQHLAMTALGFATGWRPSMMRPLRRKGGAADVLWEKGIILARRSQTRGDEVMEGTKNLSRFRLSVPEELMQILRWHADDLPEGPMRRSDLPVPVHHGRVPERDGALQALRGRVHASQAGEEDHAEGDASHVPGPRSSGTGRGVGSAEHLRAPHRGDDGALQLGGAGRGSGGDGEGGVARRVPSDPRARLEGRAGRRGV